MKKEQEKLEKQLAETQAENRRLQDPLQKVCGLSVSFLLCGVSMQCVFLCRQEKRLQSCRNN